MVTLKLQEQLTEKEIKKFKVPNELTLDDFHGCQYMMCIGGTQYEYGKYIYNTLYSPLQNQRIPVNEFMSFCELHKANIYKEKTLVGGHLVTVYYIVYVREEKPTIINDFIPFNHNFIDVELVFNDYGLYRIEELHLELFPNMSILEGIRELFSNEKIEGLPFIKTSNNQYYLEYYDELGTNTKEIKYERLIDIYWRITSVRLVGCRGE